MILSMFLAEKGDFETMKDVKWLWISLNCSIVIFAWFSNEVINESLMYFETWLRLQINEILLRDSSLNVFETVEIILWIPLIKLLLELLN